jgi:hypothetical protein
MEKLTIKELAPYLPYGLKVWTMAKAETEKGKPMRQMYGVLHGVYSEYGDETSVIFREDDTIIDYKLNEIKPVLRPLFDIAKTIEVKGEKIRTDEKIIEQHPNCPHFKYLFMEELHVRHHWMKQDLSTSFIENSCFSALIELHFDVFGLIEQELAIDINSLTPND